MEVHCLWGSFEDNPLYPDDPSGKVHPRTLSCRLVDRDSRLLKSQVFLLYEYILSSFEGYSRTPTERYSSVGLRVSGVACRHSSIQRCGLFGRNLKYETKNKNVTLFKET